MKQRGKRIRPSGKDLVFHFTIASLLPVFLLVVGLFHVKTIQQINWQDLIYHKQIRLTFLFNYQFQCRNSYLLAGSVCIQTGSL